MGFLQPLALFGLVGATIPALLHLMTRKQPPTVAFPAVRYIQETERVHSRRLKLRNLLLLILRTLLIVAAVFAASRPVLNLGVGSSHPPTAVGLMVDNSMSSGLVIDGRPVLDLIREQATLVLEGIAPDDRLWVVLADGVPRSMGSIEARQLIDTVQTSFLRLDIGEGVRAVARAVQGAGLAAAEVVVLSDLQRSALSAGPDLATRVLFWESPVPPDNHGIDSVAATGRGGGEGGHVAVWVGGTAGEPIAARLTLGREARARSVVRPGEQIVLDAGNEILPGWLVGEVLLDPDEFRADDHTYVAIREAPPSGVRVEGSVGQFMDQALRVLTEAGRVKHGSEVTLGMNAGPGVRVVFPPRDGALVGATNRSLETAGSTLRFANRVSGEWLVEGSVVELQGVVVTRRYQISGGGEVLARAGGRPWIVKDGEIVMVGSRMTREWTELPVSAAFIPFVDRLINTYAAPGAITLRVSPGGFYTVPGGVSSIVSDSVREAVAAGARAVAPIVPSVYFMLKDDGDTLGVLTVAHDPRESRLEPASAAALIASFGNAVVAPTLDIRDELFHGGGRADLTTSLIVLAAILAMGELWVATSGGGRQ